MLKFNMCCKKYNKCFRNKKIKIKANLSKDGLTFKQNGII